MRVRENSAAVRDQLKVLIHNFNFNTIQHLLLFFERFYDLLCLLLKNLAGSGVGVLLIGSTSYIACDILELYLSTSVCPPETYVNFKLRSQRMHLECR